MERRAALTVLFVRARATDKDTKVGPSVTIQELDSQEAIDRAVAQDMRIRLMKNEKRIRARDSTIIPDPRAGRREPKL